MNAFWEVPGFWQLVIVLLLVAAAATIAICFGPTETPYEDDSESDLDMADVHVKTEWGFSLTEWNALTDQDRAYFRHHVTHAKTGEPR